MSESTFFSSEGLSYDEIQKIAFDTGFCKRNSGKIKAPEFLLHFCLQSIQGTVSYNDIAGKMEAETDINASRQAYHQRMDDNCFDFFERILGKIVNSKIAHPDLNTITKLGLFSRILVQDSTVIRLPLRLFGKFSGVKNSHKSVCNARIQGVYDLASKQFIDFSIDPYSKNDLSAGLDISFENGDLVLRDRGYFSVKIIQEIKAQGADTISRYKHKTRIFDIETGVEIDLLDYLTKNGSIDKIVLCGEKEKFRVRIVAQLANEETANLRRMKAKKESKGKNPSKELLALMSWTIFITTIETEELTFEMMLKLYGLRWRIENIFKTWKSNFGFDKIHNVSDRQLRVLLTARLIMITFIYKRLFKPLSEMIGTKSKKRLSLMKFARYIQNNTDMIGKIADALETFNKKVIMAIIRYCTYDERKRENFEIQFEQIVWRINGLSFY